MTVYDGNEREIIAKYRGVDQDVIAKTLRRAWEFVRQFDLGPANKNMLLNWMDENPLEKIQDVLYDDQLVEVMHETYAHVMFKFYEPLLAFKALSQKLEKNDDEALKIYQALKGWDAFTQNETLVNPLAQKELHLFLLKECAARWDDAFENPESEAAQAFKDGLDVHFNDRQVNAALNKDASDPDTAIFLDKFREDEMVELELAKDMPGVLSFLAAYGHNEEITDLAQKNIIAATYALHGMAAALPMAKHQKILDLESSPIQNYLWEIEPMPRDLQERIDAMQNIHQKINSACMHFMELDQFLVHSSLTSTDTESFLAFKSTLTAAQALATAYPQYRVFDHNKRPIAPPGISFSTGSPPPPAP